MGNAPSQALPRQLPQGGSQDLKSVAKVSGAMTKYMGVLLALPLGELSPQVTERAHAVCPVAKVLGAMRKCPAALLALPLGELSPPQAMTERAHAGKNPFRLAAARQATFPKGTAFCSGDKLSGSAKGVPLGGAGECSEAEGVKKHPRRYKPAGVSTCYYVPCTPRGTVTQASIS